MISELAQKHVKVALTGDAGDEVFGGYNRYLFAQKFWQGLKILPGPAHVLMSRIIKAIPTSSWDSIASSLMLLRSFEHFGDKVHKVAGIFDTVSVDDVYLRLVSME